MKNFARLLLLAFSLPIFFSCRHEGSTQTRAELASLQTLTKNYYEDYLTLYPLQATINGDGRYNHLLPNNITMAHEEELRSFYQRYLDSLSVINREKLSYNDQLSFDVMKWEAAINLEGLKFQNELMPVNQFWSLTLTMGQLGSGMSIQPFTDKKDYDDFLLRIEAFAEWTDTAIANMRRGMRDGYVLPKILAQRVEPQLKNMITEEVTESLFYLPVKNFPAAMPEQEKQDLTARYAAAISGQVVPSYKKLYDFFVEEYTPACRASSGISAVPGGSEYYRFLAKQYTSTNLTPDEIFETGMQEVTRIQSEMEAIKERVGFKGTMKEFLAHVLSNPQSFPYSTAEEVLQGFRAIHEKQKARVDELFTLQPKTRFEIRQTEAFRAASASAEYQQGTADGTRPGIFYVPIIDPRQFNATGMESLFLHEAIPGHHFQVSLQQENTALPDFRKYIWYSAYGEGWALYTESLGEQLGLYTDPYQKLGNLSAEMHRAVRLVVDVGMHVKGWTREQAIQFSLEHEAETEADITAEIERYMAIPGQALSYKIGQLKILELRKKAMAELGSRFSDAAFHEAMLRNGCLPLAVLESDFNRWLDQQKQAL